MVIHYKFTTESAGEIIVKIGRHLGNSGQQ